MKILKKLLEKLEFREISAPYKDDSEERVYGLFKEDGTKIGESRFTSSRFGGKAWYLRDICILPEFERRGYGSKLLELTCSKMWSIEKKDIVLSVPGSTIAEDGFDRYQWYKRHGFTGSHDYMVRKPCVFSSFNYLCNLFNVKEKFRSIMELQEIDVFIDKDGEVKIEIRGVKGMSCLNLTKDLEAVLGDHIAEREMTHEADETERGQVQQQQWQW